MNTRVNTEEQPSERAIRGMLAACFGVTREQLAANEVPEALKNATITIETAKNGRIIRDYQTVGARTDESFFTDKIGRIFNQGAAKKPQVSWPGSLIKGQKFAAVVNRTYVADARFFVTIQGDSDEATQEISDAIANPVWSPYLGKKAFAPTAPFHLGILEEDEIDDRKQEALSW